MHTNKILDRDLRRQLRDSEVLEPGEEGPSSSDEEQRQGTKKRGRKALPFAWSKVIRIDSNTSNQVQESWIKRDQILQSRAREDKKRLTMLEWQPLFMPEMFAANNEILSLDQYRLNDEYLKR